MAAAYIHLLAGIIVPNSMPIASMHHTAMQNHQQAVTCKSRSLSLISWNLCVRSTATASTLSRCMGETDLGALLQCY